MKLGVSHIKSKDLEPSHMAYLKAMGVESLEVRLHSDQASREEIFRIKKRVNSFGMELHEIMLEDIYSSAPICLGLPGRAKDMEIFKNFIRNLGKAGIKHTTYCWYQGRGKGFETEQRTTRGCPTRGVNLAQLTSLPNAYDRVFTEEDMWATYEQFIHEMLPIAEENNVRLQLHPNDPPVDHEGVARLFKSTDAYRRAMEISNFSPHNGILFCAGCFSEMYGPDGAGENVIAAINEFASKGLIHQVHFRNTDCNLPDFSEVFLDDGRLDMPAITRALADNNFKGILVPDHVPDTSHLPGGANIAEAYAFGFIRALIMASGENAPLNQ